jgi:hypothetical protein
MAPVMLTLGTMAIVVVTDGLVVITAGLTGLVMTELKLLLSGSADTLQMSLEF